MLRALGIRREVVQEQNRTSRIEIGQQLRTTHHALRGRLSGEDNDTMPRRIRRDWTIGGRMTEVQGRLRQYSGQFREWTLPKRLRIAGHQPKHTPHDLLRDRQRDTYLRRAPERLYIRPGPG